MSKSLCIFIPGVIVLLFLGCSKTNDTLVLDQRYLNIADVVEFCTGSCDVEAPWEQSTVLLKGHLRDAMNDSVQADNRIKNRFYLVDIRNGMFIEIRVENDHDQVFDQLESAMKQDIIYVSGKANAVSAFDGSECTKGVVVLIMSTTDLLINLE
ncbi:MAG: hypothetical protein KQI35_13670 [Bacteroidetes bacterium]|nr:hypothetical protein [Bacteroidota bacterium]